MKKVIGIIVVSALSLSCFGQKVDSVQFEKLYSELTNIYEKNIGEYFFELAKDELPKVNDGSSKEIQTKKQKEIDAMVSAYRITLKDLFAEQYKILCKDLTALGDPARYHVVGYLDASIRNRFPKLKKEFYSKNLNDIMKIYKGT